MKTYGKPGFQCAIIIDVIHHYLYISKKKKFSSFLLNPFFDYPSIIYVNKCINVAEEDDTNA